ncbi:uncharacterized protein [Rhodnius prolixus]|uniref:uncharacterized protein n=1 Tax=Rhodnius prolixus TaxID=13249 RepID=UPI003D18CDA0
MEQINVNKWRKHLLNVNYTNCNDMSDKQITTMLFKQCNQRTEFLRWVIGKLSGKDKVESTKEMLNVVLNHVYIPREYHTAFIEGTMICQKELHSNIWDAIFRELKFKNENENLELVDNDNSLSNEAPEEELSDVNELSPESAQLIIELESLSKEIKHSKPKEQESIINEQLNIGVFLQNVQKFVEDYEIEPKVLVNKEFKELQTKMQLLRTSYSTIEKFREQGKEIMKCLERFKVLQMDYGENYSVHTKLNDLFKQISISGLLEEEQN